MRIKNTFPTDRGGSPLGGFTRISSTHESIEDSMIWWGEKGSSVEQVLEACRQRLLFYQSTVGRDKDVFSSHDNELAIHKIEEAIQRLDWARHEEEE